MTPDGPGRVANVVRFGRWNVAKSRVDTLHTFVVELDEGEPKRRVYGARSLQAVAA